MAIYLDGDCDPDPNPDPKLTTILRNQQNLDGNLLVASGNSERTIFSGKPGAGELASSAPELLDGFQAG